MKNITKYIVFAIILCASTTAWAGNRTIYLNTEGSDWSSKTNFWVHCWGSSTQDILMTQVSDFIYSVEVDEANTTIIFVPNNGTGSNWSGQSNNINLDNEKNCYNKQNSSWESYPATLPANLLAILDGSKVMFYAGERVDWNQSTCYAKNNGGTDVSSGTMSGNYTFGTSTTKIEFAALCTPIASYQLGHWDSGLYTTIEAGAAYIVRDNTTNSELTEIASSASNKLYKVTRSSTTTATTNIDASVTVGASISVNTTSEAGTSILNLTNTIKYYLYDGSNYSELTVTDGNADVSALSVGTGYKIITVLYDGNIYVKADEDSFDVVAATASSPYCKTEVGHFLSATADPNSFVYLSIGSDGAGHTIVRIDQDAAKNSQMFDYLQVTGKASTGTDVTTGGSSAMGVSFDTPTPDASGNITLEILWSTINWAGRWMVQNVVVPADAVCAYAIEPTPCTTPTITWETAPSDGVEEQNMTVTVTSNYPAGVRYSSSNTAVATVGETTGIINYIAAGTTTITATCTGDGSTYCTGPVSIQQTITVSEPTYKRLYFSNPSNWSIIYAYLWEKANNSNKNAGWPGEKITAQTITRNCTTYYYVEFPETKGYDRVVFNNGNSGDSNQTTDITFSDAENGKYYDTKWNDLPAEATYSLSYNANGGTGTLTDANSPYHCNDEVTVKANSFTGPDGNNFTGWNTAADGSGTSYAAGANFLITANTTLYAQWAKPSMTGSVMPNEVLASTANSFVFTFNFSNYASGQRYILINPAGGEQIGPTEITQNQITYNTGDLSYGAGEKVFKLRMCSSSSIDPIISDVEITINVVNPTPVSLSWATAPADGEVGQQQTPTVNTNYPAGVTYSSSNTSVATINATTGKITYVGVGTTTISATCTGDGVYTGSQTINQEITVSVPSTTYWLKHPWGGGSWSWQQLTFKSFDLYTLTAQYGNTGCNYRTGNSGDGTWKDKNNITIVGNPASGDMCIFSYVPSTNAITITKLVTLYVYLGETIDLGSGTWTFDAATPANGNSISGTTFTSVTLGEYQVNSETSVAYVRVYRYYVKHPWNWCSLANTSNPQYNSSWVWRAMESDGAGNYVYTGNFANVSGGTGANVGWDYVHDWDGIYQVDGNESTNYKPADTWPGDDLMDSSDDVSSPTGGNAYKQFSVTADCGDVLDFTYVPASGTPNTTGAMSAGPTSTTIYTVTFGVDRDEAGYVTTTAGSASPLSVIGGTTITFTQHEKAGGKFLGWYNNAACTGAVLSTEDTYTHTITSDYTIYAKYEPVPTVTAWLTTNIVPPHTTDLLEVNMSCTNASTGWKYIIWKLTDADKSAKGGKLTEDLPYTTDNFASHDSWGPKTYYLFVELVDDHGDVRATSDILTYIVTNKVLYVRSDDGQPNIHLWGGSSPTTTWPGVQMTPVECTENWYYHVMEGTDYTSFIININGNANKTGDLAISAYPYSKYWQFADHSLTETAAYTTNPEVSIAYNTSDLVRCNTATFKLVRSCTSATLSNYSFTVTRDGANINGSCTINNENCSVSLTTPGTYRIEGSAMINDNTYNAEAVEFTIGDVTLPNIQSVYLVNRGSSLSILPDAQPGVTYSWGGTNASKLTGDKTGAVDGAVSFDTSIPGTYYITCTATADCSSHTQNITIGVRDCQIINQRITSQAFQNANIGLDAQAQDVDGSVYFCYSFTGSDTKPDGAATPTFGTEDGHVYVHVDDHTGDYTVTVTMSTDPCGLTGILDTKKIAFTVVEQAVELTITSANHNIGTQVNLSATPINFTGTPTYVYYITEPGAADFVELSGTSFTPSAQGTYSVRVVATYNTETAYDTKTYTVTLPTYYMKHPFVNKAGTESSDWTWKQLTSDGLGNYYYVAADSYVHTQAGININTQSSDDGKTYYDYPEGGGSPKWTNTDDVPDNTKVIFFYNPSTNEVWVRNIAFQECRIKSVSLTDGTFYSNFVSNTTDSVSFYFNYTDGKLYLQTYSYDDDNNLLAIQTSPSPIMANLLKPATVTENGIYNTVLTDIDGDNTLDGVGNTWFRYRGNMYLFSAQTSWTNTTNTGKMVRFNPDRSNANEYYDHYWVNYIAYGKDVAATVGNSINHCIADSMMSYIIPHLLSDTKDGANVRYAYDSKTNLFRRTFLAGSTRDSKFLVVYGSNIGDMETYSTMYTGKDDSKLFSDISDWNYEVIVKAKAGAGASGEDAMMHISGRYNDTWRNLLSRDGSDEAAILLGKLTSVDEAFLMRINYDFKTNKIIAGWSPDKYVIDEDKTIDANLFVLREGNNAASAFGASTSQATITKKVYTIIEFNRDTIYTGPSSPRRSDLGDIYYFLSLPYTCNIQETFGLTDYDDMWIIQRWDGNLRASTGNTDAWTNMPANGQIEANKGYEIGVAYEYSDYKEGFLYRDGADVDHYRHILRLYMPSSTESFVVKPVAQYDNSSISAVGMQAPEARLINDSYWNVIGAPGFISVTTGDYSIDDLSSTYEGMNPFPNYVYTWNGGYNDYSVQDAHNFKFEATKAYFMQYYGTIKWHTDTPSPVAARRTPQNKEQDQVLCININDENQQVLDRTFVTYSIEGSYGYDFNRDLIKLGHAGASICTYGCGRELAAQDLPIESKEQSMPLRVSVDTYGEYAFSLAQRSSTPGMDVILTDVSTGNIINLSMMDYTVSLTAGDYNERFFLNLAPSMPTTPTDVDNLSSSNLNIVLSNGVLVISGLSKTTPVLLYAPSGQLVYQAKSTSSSLSIPQPSQTGVYLLRCGEETMRILIK